MAVDDPSVKDSVVLGADLVAALGFEPVTAEPEDEEVELPTTNGFVDGATAPTVDDSVDESNDEVDDSAEDLSVDTEFTDTGAVVADEALADGDALADGGSSDQSTVDDTESVLDASPIEHQGPPETEDEGTSSLPLVEESGADASLNAQDETMSTETDDDLEVSTGSSETLDDIEVIDDLVIDTESDREADLESEDDAEAAPARSRFGIRGLFSRPAESVIDESGSTRDFFSSANGDALVAPEVHAAGAVPVDADTDDAGLVEPGAAESRSFDVDDRDLGDRDLGDRDLGDRDLGDRDLGDRDLGDRDVDDRDVDDRDVDDRDVDDRDVDEIGVNDLDTERTTSLDLTGSAPTIDLDERQDAELDLGFGPDDRPVELASETAVAAAASTATVRAIDPSATKASKKLRARKSRRVVRHIDPWSVLTFSILFHLAFFSAMLLAGVLVWNAAIAAGTVESIENFIRELGDYETFEIDSSQVFRASVIIAGMLTLASSVLVVLLTVVFNLISDLVGGIRVTVIEEETVRVQTDRK